MSARLRAFARSPAFWLIGAVLVLAKPIDGWIRADAPLRRPLSPMDNVNLQYRDLWLLLRDSAEVIPVGHSYTVTSRDRDSEMLLFALSLGLLPAREPMPTSYWGILDDRPQKNGAEYVVSLACVGPPGSHRLRLRLPSGCVFVREGGPP